MSYNIDGILNDFDIKDANIIDTIDINKYVYINDYINNNNDKNVIEILNISLEIKDIDIKKLNNNATTIYCINYMYLINIDLSIDFKLKKLKLEDLLSYSFMYKDINKFEIEIKPVNFKIKKLEEKVYINSNLIIMDKSNDIKLEYTIEQNNQIIENTNNKDYLYININQEFI